MPRRVHSIQVRARYGSVPHYINAMSTSITNVPTTAAPHRFLFLRFLGFSGVCFAVVEAFASSSATLMRAEILGGHEQRKQATLKFCLP